MPTLRRMSDRELASVLSLLASAGGTARTVESWQADRMTALLLPGTSGETGGIAAAMPLAIRQIHTAPARPITVGWLSSNQFASRMSLRRQTRDTHAQWPGLLDEVDALLVIRRDEPSLAARWYAATGFADVLSIRCLYLDMDAAPASTVTGRFVAQVVSPDEQWTRPEEAARWQTQMLSVYNEVYSATGGTPLRHPAFWQNTLAHHYYREHYQFQVIGLWNGATLMGYAVVGWSGWHSKRPRMDILELATRQWDTTIAAELIQTTAQLAWSKSVPQVRAVISVHDPYRGHLARTGFIDRWGYLMLAKWLHPQRHLERLARNLPTDLVTTGGLNLRLTTPGQLPLTLISPNTSAPAIQLETDQKSLTRLLLSRLDVSAALADRTLFSPAATLPPDLPTRLSLTFPWTPWTFHMLDYI